MENKQFLRRLVREKKRAMSEADILRRSEWLGKLLRQQEEYRQADTIYGYLPFNQEVRLLPILEQAMKEGKRVAVPKILGNEMIFVYIEDFSRIQTGRGGVPEPVADGPIARVENALVILPGLVFDQRGNRIGYGGGYYDRFLTRESNHPTIALCYDFQVVAHLEADPHDVPAGKILWV